METQSKHGSNNSQAAPPARTFPDEFAAAYERRLAEIQAVEDDALVPANVDIHDVVATVLGAVPEILVFREALSKMEALNQTQVSGLEDYAEAAGEAHSRYVIALTPKEDIVALNEAALKTRETFRLVAQVLTQRGFVDPDRLASFTGRTGYKNVGFELIDWANLMKDAWRRIDGKAGLTLGEIHEAKALGVRLVRAAGEREQAPAHAAELARIRRQALTLLVNAYDEVRRGLQFLRWHEGDADEIAPSLYAGRPRRRKEEAEEPAADGAPDAPAAPPESPPPAPPGEVPVGFPGGNPFLS